MTLEQHTEETIQRMVEDAAEVLAYGTGVVLE